MPCFVPFHNKNLDISFFLFKPVGVFVEDLLETLKYFSSCSESHGCVSSSIFNSLHGNLIVWYGAWMKRSNEKKKLLKHDLISALENISSVGILLDYGFFEAYAGESKDKRSLAKFSTGDTISINSMLPNSENLADLSYACLSLVKSYFLSIEGTAASVCFQCFDDRPAVVSLHVWKSRHSCYSWLLETDYRKSMSRYLEHLALDVRQDVFTVVFVSSDDLLSVRLFPHHMLADHVEEINEQG